MLRYAVFKTSGMTATSVRRVYGFERMGARALSVEAALSEVRQILASVKDKFVLASFGNETADDSSSSHEEDERENVSPGILEELSVGGDKSVKSVAIAQPQPCSLHKKPDINHMLEQSKYNCSNLLSSCIYEESCVMKTYHS